MGRKRGDWQAVGGNFRREIRGEIWNIGGEKQKEERDRVLRIVPMECIYLHGIQEMWKGRKEGTEG